LRAKSVVFLLAVYTLAGCSESGREAEPATSSTARDTSRIAFEVLTENESDPDPSVLSSSDTEIQTTDPDGSAVTKLTENVAVDSVERWSPDGTRIAVTRDDAGQALVSIHADGSGETLVVAGESTCPMTLDWSPDSEQIVFSMCDAKSGRAALYKADADGSTRERLTYGNFSAFQPAWSPNGTEIAFVCVGPKSGICAMSSDGRAMRRLTSSSGDSAPAWSPDAEKIAFVRYPNGGVYVMNPDGTEVVRLAAHSDAANLAWSPDATRVAFENGDGRIYVVGLDGSAPLSLSEPGAMDFSPSWSPDGMKLAFVNRENEVYVMNADGSGRRRITHTDGNASNPLWSPGA
jgi:TolB protein